MFTIVLVPPSWSGIDDFLSVMAWLHLAILELLWSVLAPECRSQLVTLTVIDGLVWASDEVLWF